MLMASLVLLNRLAPLNSEDVLLVACLRMLEVRAATARLPLPPPLMGLPLRLPLVACRAAENLPLASLNAARMAGDGSGTLSSTRTMCSQASRTSTLCCRVDISCLGGEVLAGALACAVSVNPPAPAARAAGQPQQACLSASSAARRE
jgi:hypothetical protein